MIITNLLSNSGIFLVYFKYILTMNYKHPIYIEVNCKFTYFLNKLHLFFLVHWNKMDQVTSSSVFIVS
jgi:hypothetical protein